MEQTMKINDMVQVKRDCGDSLLRTNKLYKIVAVGNGTVKLAEVECPYRHDGYWSNVRFEVVVIAPTLDLSKPVQTKGGLPVRILCTDGPSLNSPVVGFVGNNVHTTSWTKGGRWSSSTAKGCMDLVNVPSPPPAEATREVYLWRSISLTGKPSRVFTTVSPDLRKDATLIGKQSVTVKEGDNL